MGEVIVGDPVGDWGGEADIKDLVEEAIMRDSVGEATVGDPVGKAIVLWEIRVEGRGGCHQ